MLPMSTEFAAMMAANWRRLRTLVSMDLDRLGDFGVPVDVSNFLAKWHIERTISTDVPAAARMTTGFIAAEFTATPIGRNELGERVSPGRNWSPYSSTGIMFGKDPTNVTTEVFVGIGDGRGGNVGVTSEKLQRGKFYIDTLSVSGEDDSIIAYDGYSQLDQDVNIPMMGGSWKNTGAATQTGVRPGLSNGTVLDFALRQNGHYQTPPPRPGCVLSVPAHGSLYPEPDYGWLDATSDTITHGTFEQDTHATSTAQHDGDPVSFDHVGAFGGGLWGDDGQSGITPSVVPICTGTSTARKDYKASWQPANFTPGGTPVNYGNFFDVGKSVTFEAWVFIPETPPQGYASTQPMWGLRFRQTPTAANSNTAHVYSVGLYASGAPYLVVGPNFTRTDGTAPGLTGWVYVLGTIKNNGASGTTLTILMSNDPNDDPPQTTLTVADQPAQGLRGSSGQFRVQLCTNRVAASTDGSTGVITSFEALQITNESEPIEQIFNFVPDAFCDYSLAPLVATPVSAANGPLDAKSLIVDLTKAEFGMSYFNENGAFYFFNRARWGRPPGNTSVTTLTTEDEIADLKITYSRQGVINDITINYAPYAIEEFQKVYQSEHRIQAHAGATATYIAHLDSPVLGLDLGNGQMTGQGALSPIPAGEPTASGYRASWWEDGTTPAGSGLTDPPTNISVRTQQIGPTRVKITLTNNEIHPVYLVSGDDQADSSRGTPFVVLFGRPVGVSTNGEDGISTSDGNTGTVNDFDQPSIDKYGHRPWSNDPNDWLQSVNVATQVLSTLLGQLKDAHPLIEQVTFKGNAGLQIGDRVTLQDNGGTQLDTSDDTIGTVIVELADDWEMADDFSGGGYTMTGTLRLMDLSQPIT